MTVNSLQTMKSLLLLLRLAAVTGFVRSRTHRGFSVAHIRPQSVRAVDKPLYVSNHNNTTNGLYQKAQKGGKNVWQSIKGAASRLNASSLSGIASRIDQVGASTKPKAKQASILYTASTDKWKRFGYLAKAFFFYTINLWYQAIRGIIVTMPPVYQQYYAKFSNMVEYPFEDDSVITRDVNPETGKLRWRTKINVGLLAAVLSASYTVDGALKVGRAWATEIWQSRSLLNAMMKAVETQEENQIKMTRIGNRPLPKPKNYF